MCQRLGVRYVLIKPDVILRRTVPRERPAAIDDFLNLMDDPDSYPVLIHCKAGLHRTGCLTAVYRMEYQGWSPGEAYSELKAHGFGDWVCTSANDYVNEYVLQYRRGLRGLKPSPVGDDPAMIRPKGASGPTARRIPARRIEGNLTSPTRPRGSWRNPSLARRADRGPRTDEA